MTGTRQAWFIERYDTYEAMEKAIKLTQAEPLKATIDALDAQDGELRTGERGIIATYQPDLSYLPGTQLEAKLRYFNINVVRVRPGHTADFTEVRKLINAAFAKTGSQQRRVVYSVNSGMPIGTYLILAPMNSLNALDPRPGAMSMVDAFGPENLARVDKLMTEIQISAESTLFSVNPKMSNAPKEYITADADFWAPKPKPTAGKPAIAAKTSSSQ